MVQPRIVNGDRVSDRRTRPYMVRLQDPSTTNPFCAGSLVSVSYVLTAAHCTDGIALERHPNTELVLGDLSSNAIDELGEQRFRVPTGNAIRHPRWINFNHAFVSLELYDMAFHKLPTPARLDEYTQIIRIHTTLTRNNLEGEKVTVSGWGALFINGPTFSELQTAELDGQSCVGERHSEMSLCYSGRMGTSTTCGGDSGTPVVMVIKGTPVQIGVHNSGTCLPNEYPIAGFGAWASWREYTEFLCSPDFGATCGKNAPFVSILNFIARG